MFVAARNYGSSILGSRCACQELESSPHEFKIFLWLCSMTATVESNKTEAGSKGKKPAKWKQQSAQLRAAMLAARPNNLGEARRYRIGGDIFLSDEPVVLDGARKRTVLGLPHDGCQSLSFHKAEHHHLPSLADILHSAQTVIESLEAPSMSREGVWQQDAMPLSN